MPRAARTPVQLAVTRPASVATVPTSDSSKRLAASATTASTASAACWPAAMTSTRCPRSAAERGHSRQASAGHRAGACRQVRQRHLGVEGPELAYEACGRPGMQPVHVRHREGRTSTRRPTGSTLAPRPRRAPPALAGPGMRAVTAWRAGRRPPRPTTSVRGGTPGGSHRGDDQTLDQRRGTEHDALAQRRLDQVERELCRQHVRCRDPSGRQRRSPSSAATSASMIAVASVPNADRLPRRARRRRDREPCPAAPSRRRARRPRRPAHGCARRPRSPSSPVQPRVRAAEATSMAAEVAPGSWWPTLRSPR